MTREDILEIDTHCAKRGISRAAYLRELGLSQNAYYNARRRYLGDFKELSNDLMAEGSSTNQPQAGSFLPIQFTRDTPPATPKRTRSRRKQEQELANGNTLLIEMRTPSGTELRIQGQINIKMLKEIIHASGGGLQDV